MHKEGPLHVSGKRKELCRVGGPDTGSVSVVRCLWGSFLGRQDRVGLQPPWSWLEFLQNSNGPWATLLPAAMVPGQWSRICLGGQQSFASFPPESSVAEEQVLKAVNINTNHFFPHYYLKMRALTTLFQNLPKDGQVSETIKTFFSLPSQGMALCPVSHLALCLATERPWGNLHNPGVP